MDEFTEITVVQAAGEWYRKKYHPAVTGKIDIDVPNRPDGNGQWRVVIYPRDGSPEVTAGVTQNGSVDLIFPYATELKGPKRRITI